MFIVFLIYYAKLVNSLLLVNFSRFKDAAGEICVVGAVGEVLCLEAEGAVLAVNCPVCAYKTAVPVAAIELNARFCCPHLQATSAVGLYALHSV